MKHVIAGLKGVERADFLQLGNCNSQSSLRAPTEFAATESRSAHF